MKKRKRLANCRGETLVEVIVSFALTAMLLLMAVMAVSAAVNAFYRMQSLAHATVVSDTILNKIEGELSQAQADGASVVLGSIDGKPAADFTAKDANRICMTEKDGYFTILYHVWDTEAEHLAEGWRFGESMYQGFQISELRFEPDQQENTPGNLVRVTLTLQKGEAYSYTSIRYVQLENFKRASDIANIKEGEI